MCPVILRTLNALDGNVKETCELLWDFCNTSICCFECLRPYLIYTMLHLWKNMFSYFILSSTEPPFPPHPSQLFSLPCMLFFYMTCWLVFTECLECIFWIKHIYQKCCKWTLVQWMISQTYCDQPKSICKKGWLTRKYLFQALSYQ